MNAQTKNCPDCEFSQRASADGGWNHWSAGRRRERQWTGERGSQHQLTGLRTGVEGAACVLMLTDPGANETADRQALETILEACRPASQKKI